MNKAQHVILCILSYVKGNVGSRKTSGGHSLPGPWEATKQVLIGKCIITYVNTKMQTTKP